MKQKLILLTIAMLATTIATAQSSDTVQLPYTANFTQGWTATGGATIIDSNHASITSQGQTLVSPWIEVSSGQTYLNFNILRSNGFWEYTPDSSRNFTETVVDVNGNILHQWNLSVGGSNNGIYPIFTSNGGPVRVEITYTDTTPAWMFSVSDLRLYQYPMTVTIEAPATVHLGDTTTVLAHLTIPTGETAEWEWTFRNGLEYNDFVAAADTTMFASTDSSKTLVWNTPGTYYVNVDVHHWNPYAYVSIRHIITVLDTTTVDCDSIRLPYSADFTQCWTTSGGATIIDINHASITSQGQRLVGPWMASTEGKCFINWSMSRIGEINYNSEQYTLTIEGEDSVITSWIEYAGNWSIGNNFTSPGGRIRIVFEYTGTNAVPTFQITDIRIFQYDIEATLEASSSIAQVGDTITFIIHSTLQNGEVPDNYSMDTYNSQGQWMYENDPDRTIVSNTDSIYKVVWNTAGRYRVYGGVHKYVDNTGWAYATSSLGIIITDHPVYAEDSIYYTSAAKDTVIGCHPDLHVANLPESITVIADSAFFNLSNLSIIELPIGLRTIGKMAFAWNQGISEITIPQNVTFVGDNAFCWDTNLTTVNFNATNCQTMSPSTDENGNYWPIFIGCDNITAINIGENVTRIPDRAFSYCSGLHGTLTIPDAVTYIGRSAFYHWINDWDWDNGSYWDTLSIVLGAGLTEIGDYAFGCPRAHITSVISHNPEPPIIGEQTFYRYEPEYTPRLQVPCGSAAAYRNAQHWSRIEEIIEDCDGIEDAENDARTPAILSDNGIITVVGATELVSVYDMMGRLVSAYMPTDFRCTIVVPHSGVYMVKIGDCPARKIVVVK